MQLLTEVTRTPHASQRDLSKRIGVALGLTNLLLYRLTKKGYIKIRGTKRSRIRYLITPTGILEKSRLTYEFVQYSLQLYSRVRRSLREQLVMLAHAGARRVLLFGTGELAEIAFLTIQEMGLEFAGVAVDDAVEHQRFLGHQVRSIRDVPSEDYDRIVVTSLPAGEGPGNPLLVLGIPMERMIVLPLPGMPSLSEADVKVVALAPVPLASVG
ncbi:MAG: winged helix-turn-helix transcriptional regulator [Candidatus Omnitrophica bacterium]|nr:winged helix-turn-helix transcriptional regulator [Candidatus Omnitrophota bacterium]